MLAFWQKLKQNTHFNTSSSYSFFIYIITIFDHFFFFFFFLLFVRCHCPRACWWGQKNLPDPAIWITLWWDKQHADRKITIYTGKSVWWEQSWGCDQIYWHASLQCGYSRKYLWEAGNLFEVSVFKQSRMHLRFVWIQWDECLKTYLSDYDRNGGIPWDNLVAFNSDKCSVMKGKHHSVITKLRASQPYVQDVGCICHLAQLVTGCGIKAIKAPVEDLLGGVYSHFHKRSV